MGKKKKNGPNRSQKPSYNLRLQRHIKEKNCLKEVELANREAEVARMEAALYKQQVDQKSREVEESKLKQVEQPKAVEQPAAGPIIMSQVFWILDFWSFSLSECILIFNHQTNPNTSLNSTLKANPNTFRVILQVVDTASQLFQAHVDVEEVARVALRMMEVENPNLQSPWAQEAVHQKQAEAGWTKGIFHVSCKIYKFQITYLSELYVLDSRFQI